MCHLQCTFPIKVGGVFSKCGKFCEVVEVVFCCLFFLIIIIIINVRFMIESESGLLPSRFSHTKSLPWCFGA